MRTLNPSVSHKNIGKQSAVSTAQTVPGDSLKAASLPISQS